MYRWLNVTCCLFGLLIPEIAFSQQQPATPAQIRSQAFVVQFDEFEKKVVGALWHCLNNGQMATEDVSGHEEVLILNISDRLLKDPSGYPELVRSQCVPLGLQAVEKVAALSSPPEFAAALGKYRQSLQALIASLKLWARPLADDADRAQDLATFFRLHPGWVPGKDKDEAGKRADPPAWQFDRFVNCAVPGDQLKSNAVLDLFLYEKCSGHLQNIDPAFFTQLRNKCLPGLRAVPTQMPPNFEATQQRLSTAFPPTLVWGFCFARMLMQFRGQTVLELHAAWKNWSAASVQVHESRLAQPTPPDPRVRTPEPPLPPNEQAGRELFGKKFTAFELREVETLWTCLFGPKRFDRSWPQSALWMALDSQQEQDPRGFPRKVLSTCVPLGQQLVQKVPGLSPPAALSAPLTRYRQALSSMVAVIKQWAEQAPGQAELILNKQAVKNLSSVWSQTPDREKANSQAWQYDRFLHCAISDLDQLPDSNTVREWLAARCPRRRIEDAAATQAFLTRLRTKCLPEIRTALNTAPPNFATTHQRLSPAYFEVRDLFARCFSMDEFQTQSPPDAAKSAKQDWEQAAIEIGELCTPRY